MAIPLNRIVAFVKPWINLVAGALAAFLVARLNILGIDGLDEENTATWIAGALAWILTTGVTELGDLKWLKGHHISIAADAEVTAAALAPVPPVVAAEDLTGTIVDPEAAAAPADVSDEEELASPPPPDETNTPVQPSQDP